MQHGVSDRGDSHAEPARAGRDGMLAWTALAGAVLASSCCVLPLVFVLVGLGGTWVASLRALAPYKPLFLAGTALALGAGFWVVYGRPAPVCAPDTLCARPRSRRLTRTALWAATTLALLAATADYWAPLFY
jgi:mercuric ion transport protein